MMSKFNKKCAVPLILAAMASPAMADHQEENSALQDAWLDGKLDAVVLLNPDLNPFDIDTDVVDGTAIVTGKVNSPIQKSLVSELAVGIEGIDSVDNQLLLEAEPHSLSDSTSASTSDRAISLDGVVDASITTAISTKLLLNSAIDSSKIEVDTSDKTVTLKGRVESELKSNLVEQIALNTFEVEQVDNRLLVVN